MALWNFNTGVNREIVKCAISWKRRIVGRIGRKFRARGTMYCTCMVFFMFEFSFWSFGTLCNFPMLRYSKGLCSPSFHSISTKLIVIMFVRTECTGRVLLFWRSTKIKKILWHFEIFASQDHLGLEISKHYSFYSFDCVNVTTPYFAVQRGDVRALANGIQNKRSEGRPHQHT